MNFGFALTVIAPLPASATVTDLRRIFGPLTVTFPASGARNLTRAQVRFGPYFTPSSSNFFGAGGCSQFHLGTGTAGSVRVKRRTFRSLPAR